MPDLTVFREEITERFLHLMQGDYNEHYGYTKYGEHPILLHRSEREIGMLIHGVLSDYFSKDELAGLQCLVRPSFGKIREGAMKVALNPKTHTIDLVIDPRYLEAMLDATEKMKVAHFVVEKEVEYLIRHELWHVLLGHNYIPMQYQTHPYAVTAVEVCVNDGALRIGESEPAYPFVSLARMGLLDQAQQVARQMGLPDGWLMDFRAVLRVLEQLYQTQVLHISLERCSCSEQAGEHQVLVVKNLSTGEEFRFHDFSLVPSHQTDADTTDQILRELIPYLSDRFQYDAVERRFNYSPDGYGEAERIIRPKAIIVPWQKIRHLLMVEKRPGFNRRTFHFYPPDEQPLVTRALVRNEEVLVYIDSSGSISDDIISTFIGTARQSPFRVRIFYFSTVVTEQPHTGGTDYGCIVQHVRDYLAAGNRLPKAILVFTDGKAEPVELPNPERWYWVVIGDDTIPRQCGGHILKAVESVG